MILKGTFLHTPALGELEVRQNAYLVSEGETIVGLYDTLPPEYTGQPVEDWGDALIIPAFTDLHIHAPQIINRGIGYDKELLPWLETYTFPAEARFADPAFSDRAWKACALPPLPPSTRRRHGVLWSCPRPPASGDSSAR